MRDIVHGTNSLASKRPRRERAFTLIELLVVIGIIAILMSILVPIISKVRTAGFDSATTHRMQAIMTAIGNYYEANGAYPGPLDDKEVYSTANTATVKALKNTNTGNLPPGLTSTENLTLGLLGGAVPVTVPSFMINYDPLTVGPGPIGMNQLQAKKYGPYAEAKACGLELPQSNGRWLKWADPNHAQAVHQSLYADTEIPEFTDSFPDALPILYMRAAGGPAVNVSIQNAPSAKDNSVNSATPWAWDPSQLKPYIFPAIPSTATQPESIANDTYTGSVDPSVQSDYATPHYYFTAGDHVTPLQKGGYMLIVAGKDRKFMTRDDRINGVPAQ